MTCLRVLLDPSLLLPVCAILSVCEASLRTMHATAGESGADFALQNLYNTNFNVFQHSDEDLLSFSRECFGLAP
jgi:hypothetical protein